MQNDQHGVRNYGLPLKYAHLTTLLVSSMPNETHFFQDPLVPWLLSRVATLAEQMRYVAARIGLLVSQDWAQKLAFLSSTMCTHNIYLVIKSPCKEYRSWAPLFAF